MLNTFGDLLTFGLVAPFLLRVIIGLIFIGFGYIKAYGIKKDSVIEIPGCKKENLKIIFGIIALVETIAGILLIIGLYTQISAIIIALLSLGAIILKYKHRSAIKNSFLFYILVFTIAISLIFSGAGFWAFDLPL